VNQTEHDHVKTPSSRRSFTWRTWLSAVLTAPGAARRYARRSLKALRLTASSAPRWRVRPVTTYEAEEGMRMSLGSRVYLWLVRHNACPCGVFARVPVFGAWASYYCGNVLERRFLGDV
jgi:hypothetical protein